MTYEHAVKKIINNETLFWQMKTYVKLIETTNQIINLTKFKADQLWKEGIYQSLICFENAKWEGKFLDIGSGAGFPSIPLLITKPNINLTIIEAQTKKIKFLQTVAKHLQLNLQLIHKRSEDLENQKFDFITARAVAPLAKLIKISYHLGNNNATFYWIKGKNVHQELKTAQDTISKLKIKNIKIIQKMIAGKEVNIICYQKRSN